MTSQVDYTANGSIVAFPYPFAIPAKSALEVRINDVIQDVGFVITGAGSADGGNVIFASAPADGLAISLRYLGAVTITAQDATVGHLSDKLVAGAGISLETVTGPGGVQSLKVNADESVDALEKDQNLADLPDKAQARTNLGVYSKAEVEARDQAVKDAALLKVNNLSDLTDVAAARSNLELGSAAMATLGTGLGQVPTSDQVAALVQSVPVGTVINVAMSSAPTGYLKADGSAVGRTAYAALFTAIGTAFGIGNGQTTFNLPDLRGEFVRGWDDGRGVDNGRELGTHQGDEFKSHTHSVASLWNGSGATRVRDFGCGADAPFATPGPNVNASGGYETRPRNIALLACIKY